MSPASRGLTLVECLVSIVILGFGVIAAAHCINASLLTNLKAHRMAIGTTLAQSAIETVRSESADGYLQDMAAQDAGNPNLTVSTSGTTTTVTETITGVPELLKGQRTVVVAVYTADAAINSRVRLVTVTVSWQGPSTRESCQLQTIISNAPKV